MNITVSRDIYEWIVKKRGFASQIAEKAYFGLKSVMEGNGCVDIYVGGLDTPILGFKSENNPKNEWSRRDSDPRPPACKAFASSADIMEIAPESDCSGNPENFSTPARGEPYMSIGDWMADKEEKFLNFCLHTRPATTHKQTREGYYRALAGMTGIYTPEDVAALGTTTKTVLRALSKFHAFVTTKYGFDGFNGYSLAQWKGNQKEASYAVGSRGRFKTKNLTDEEIRAGLNSIADKEARMFYLLCVCSGSRPAHLYKWLKSSDRKIERLPGKIIRADVRDTSAGTKEEVYFYFPEEMEQRIARFRPRRAVSTLEKLCQCGTTERPINLSSIRKWHFNMCLDNMPQITANAIQGRAMRGIDEIHYFDAAGSGAKYYPAIAEHIRTMMKK